MKRLLIIGIVLAVSVSLNAQLRWNSRYQAYIDKYKDLAIAEMLKYDIPASITLAQGLLESGAGMSELAKQGFVEIRPRQGAVVADYRRRGNLSTLIAIMEYQGGVLGKEEVQSILEVRLALEHLAVSNAIDRASDEALERLGTLLAEIAGCDTPAQAAEAAWIYQHELALVSGNSILPLIYYSFKKPVITLWTRFCRLYGIEALLRNTERLYDCIRARDEQAAAEWIDRYLGQAIRGSQQIYSER